MLDYLIGVRIHENYQKKNVFFINKKLLKKKNKRILNNLW